MAQAEGQGTQRDNDRVADVNDWKDNDHKSDSQTNTFTFNSTGTSAITDVQNYQISFQTGNSSSLADSNDGWKSRNEFDEVRAKRFIKYDEETGTEEDVTEELVPREVRPDEGTKLADIWEG